MKTTATLLLLTAFLSTTGCLGPAIATSMKTRAHDREGFAKANLEREAAGLPPLTKKQYMNMDDRSGSVVTPAPAPTTTTTTTTSGDTTVTERHVIIR